ncbi:MAG TPA: class I SAM-dependent methyltransferase [Solirubrobacteraceae bacterium]|nr:class I SAM-dependent methyltransferase [Solirubrobacteraceae bacterium]
MSAGRVLEHYGTAPLWERVRDALDAAGLGGDRIAWAQLAPVDEFHLRGLVATRELAEALGPRPGAAVLDVGSGLGGPARLLAAEYDCSVTGADLNPEFVDVATQLTRRCGLEERVRFVGADALALPFADGEFDHVITQHAAMNIADRARLYAEIARVLAPGGRLAIHDVVAGDGQPLRFPVPWSRTPETSHLLTADQTRAAVARAGFTEVSDRDQTQVSADWAGARFATPAGGGAPPFGLPVIMGPAFAEMSRNLAANLSDGRVGVLQLVAQLATVLPAR